MKTETLMKEVCERLEKLDKQKELAEHQAKRLQKLEQHIDVKDKVKLQKLDRIKKRLALRLHRLNIALMKLRHAIDELVETLSLINILDELRTA